jgi:hypothetical protein
VNLMPGLSGRIKTLNAATYSASPLKTLHLFNMFTCLLYFTRNNRTNTSMLVSLAGIKNKSVCKINTKIKLLLSYKM